MYAKLWLKHWCYVLGILGAKTLHGLFPGVDHLLRYKDTLYNTTPLELIAEGYESCQEAEGPWIDTPMLQAEYPTWTVYAFEKEAPHE